jgi:hypothetical protein
MRETPRKPKTRLSPRRQRRRCFARARKVAYIGRDGRFHTRHIRCRQWALIGKTRCRMHGGKNTGPKTPEGKARVVAAMVEGRRKWVERMKAEGRKFLCGRKAGLDWVTLFLDLLRICCRPAHVVLNLKLCLHREPRGVGLGTPKIPAIRFAHVSRRVSISWLPRFTHLLRPPPPPPPPRWFEARPIYSIYDPKLPSAFFRASCGTSSKATNFLP